MHSEFARLRPAHRAAPAAAASASAQRDVDLGANENKYRKTTICDRRISGFVVVCAAVVVVVVLVKQKQHNSTLALVSGFVRHQSLV